MEDDRYKNYDYKTEVDHVLHLPEAYIVNPNKIETEGWFIERIDCEQPNNTSKRNKLNDQKAEDDEDENGAGENGDENTLYDHISNNNNNDNSNNNSSKEESDPVKKTTVSGSQSSPKLKKSTTNKPVVRMVYRDNVQVVPAIVKLFDEILVNAADRKKVDPTMNMIKVEINRNEGWVSVWNNGEGIPVIKDPKLGIYIGDMIFGMLRTSSNYDTSQKKTVAGKFGEGAKFCNIFSKKFMVETVDTVQKKKYKQVWTDNMKQKMFADPKITDLSGLKTPAKGYTQITFWLDFARFAGGTMTSFNDNQTWQIMERRAYDVAATCGNGLTVKLNGETIHMKDFKSYCRSYLNHDVPPPPPCSSVDGAGESTMNDEGAGLPTSASSSDSAIVLNRKLPFYLRVNDRWEIAVGPATGRFDRMEHISFVNSSFIPNGGSHVDYVAEQVVGYLCEYLQNKQKIDLKSKLISKCLFVFVNCLLVNPEYDQGTKTQVIMSRTAFGSRCVIPESFLQSLAKCDDIVQPMVRVASNVETKVLAKNSGKKSKRVSGIPKLEDANEAGGKNAHLCTLILTEGDSAKALAVSGLSVVGRDHFGVFPLKGKLLNVREIETSKAVQNEEIRHLVQIIGLKFGKAYTDTSELRYGHVMIMTDQDHDGSHIKGLVINLFSAWWPELLKIEGFLQEFITPIVKVNRATGQGQCISFYTIPEYHAWLKNNNHGIGWVSKYYKGLGTSTSAEAKEYFSNLKLHRLNFKYASIECEKSVDLAFNKKKQDARKDWLAEFQEGTYVDQSKGSLTYYDFVHKELILFSMASNLRTIPSVVDGQKPGQRKILFVCFKRNLLKQIKVAQLAGSVAEKSAYHHGEASLMATIIGLAQDHCGSNNLYLLEPIGQFGTRHNGGKDAASPRYIFTHLSSIARFVFPRSDDAVLKYLEDDGQSVEPQFYVPILPMVLVNGCAGIGTGWASFIPNYNPRDIVANLKRLLNGEPLELMHPWYRNFNGLIKRHPGSDHLYLVYGRIEKVDALTIKITELPIQCWTCDHKLIMEQLLDAKEIAEFREYHGSTGDDSVCFVVRFTEDQMLKAQSKGLYKMFKLIGTLSTNNMILHNPQGQLTKYQSPLDVLKTFFGVRLETYQKRKQAMINSISQELTILENQVKYIRAVRSGQLKLNQSNSDLLKQLVQDGYQPRNEGVVKSSSWNREEKEQKEAEEQSETEQQQNQEKTNGGSCSSDDPDSNSKSIQLKHFYYLVHQTQLSLTVENAEIKEKEYQQLSNQLETLRKTTIAEMWRADLDEFLLALDDFDLKHQEKLNQKPILSNQLVSDMDNSQTKSKNKKLGKIKNSGQKSTSTSLNLFDIAPQCNSDSTEYLLPTALEEAEFFGKINTRKKKRSQSIGS